MSAATTATVSYAGRLSRRQIAWASALLAPAVLGPLWVAGLSFVSGPEGLSLATLTGFIVTASVAVAAYTDARWRTIPNWLTYSAVLWGVGLNAYASWAPASAGYLGAIGLSASLIGLVLLFTLFLIVFSFTGGGAGDVKLAGALGALLGFELGAEALVYAFIAAGVFVAAWSVLRIGPVTTARLLARRFGGFLFPAWVGPITDEDRKVLATPIALGPFFALGTLVVVTGWNQTIERLLIGG